MTTLRLAAQRRWEQLLRTGMRGQEARIWSQEARIWSQEARMRGWEPSIRGREARSLPQVQMKRASQDRTSYQ